jgi:hypothetical protein
MAFVVVASSGAAAVGAANRFVTTVMQRERRAGENLHW